AGVGLESGRYRVGPGARTRSVLRPRRWAGGHAGNQRFLCGGDDTDARPDRTGLVHQTADRSASTSDALTSSLLLAAQYLCASVPPVTLWSHRSTNPHSESPHMKYLTVLAALTTLASLPAAAATTKPTIVLVHGAWETADIWQGVKQRLMHDGFSVVVVPLPGRPGNDAAHDHVSLDLYRDTVLHAIADQAQPVVLVGHSFGGFTISAVAESAPEKIKTLVYLSAYLPKDGQS